jgi:hypothetical protein
MLLSALALRMWDLQPKSASRGLHVFRLAIGCRVVRVHEIGDHADARHQLMQ